MVGQDKQGNLLVLGGNQGNKVSIAKFPRSRVTAYVWADKAVGVPSNPAKSRYQLPVLNNVGGFSKNEA